MENKRKIWVRVAAFMAAIICCVLCVVPAYAEEGETTEQDLKDEVARQAGVLEALAGRSMDIAIDPQLSTRLAEYGKTYDDVTFYGHIASDMVALGSKISTSLYTQIQAAGFVHLVVRDSGGAEVVNVVYRIQSYSFANYLSSATTTLKLSLANNSTADSLPEINVYCDMSTHLGYSVHYRKNSSNKTTYSVSDGYSYEVDIVSWGSVNDVIGYQQSAYTFINPSELLRLDVSAIGSEEWQQRVLEARDEGREEGYAQGRQIGYNAGYDDGMQQTSLIDGIKSLFRAPMEFVESALNFEIFGVNMAGAVKTIITAMMIALVVVVVWKAVK